MQSYADFSEQAWLCAHYARASRHDRVAEELWRTAQEYQRKAADLNSGVAPDIGEPPSLPNSEGEGGGAAHRSKVLAQPLE